MTSPARTGSRILGIGTAVPASVLPQDEAATLAARLMEVKPKRERAVHALYARSGVDQRHVIFREPGSPDLYADPMLGSLGPTTGARLDAFHIAATDLAARACRDALQIAGVDADAIGGVVVVSCTGMRSPGVEVGLIDRLGLSPGVSRTHIGFMGCHGAINGLRVGDAFARAQPDKAVLVCCVELCSLHFQHRPANGAATANALFGDGAAAVVLRAGDTNEPEASTPTLADFSSTVIPGTGDDMGWRVGDHGFEMTLSPAVPQVLREHVRPWIDGWLRERGVTTADIERWVLHPGGPSIVDAVADAVDADDASRSLAASTLAHFGNMSSPTVLFMLRRSLEEDAGMRRCAVLAFGPGLVGEGALVERGSVT